MLQITAPQRLTSLCNLHSVIATPLIALSLASCAPSRQQQAEYIYSQAASAFSAKKIGTAKVLLDSLNNYYMDVPSVYRNAHDLSRAVKRYENERTISFLDSALSVCASQQTELLKTMVVEDPDNPSPRYIARSQQAYNSFSRCLLRAAADANGIFSLSSVFTGPKPIHHDHCILRSGDLYVEMSPVSDGSYNHTFTDGESVWETVMYPSDEAAAVAKFIEANQSERISVEYLGPKAHYVSYMTDVDKAAIVQVWSLSSSLRESRKIKSLIRSTRLEMTKRGY